MQPPSRRLALRFGLGSLFLALTIASLLLAWGTSIVRERTRARQEFESTVGVDFYPSELLRQQALRRNFPADSIPDGDVAWWRKMLGDEAVELIYFPMNRPPSQAEKERLERLFPEAIVDRHRP